MAEFTRFEVIRMNVDENDKEFIANKTEMLSRENKSRMIHQFILEKQAN